MLYNSRNSLSPFANKQADFARTLHNAGRGFLRDAKKSGNHEAYLGVLKGFNEQGIDISSNIHNKAQTASNIEQDNAKMAYFKKQQRDQFAALREANAAKNAQAGDATGYKPGVPNPTGKPNTTGSTGVASPNNQGTVMGFDGNSFVDPNSIPSFLNRNNTSSFADRPVSPLVPPSTTSGAGYDDPFSLANGGKMTSGVDWSKMSEDTAMQSEEGRKYLKDNELGEYALSEEATLARKLDSKGSIASLMDNWKKATSVREAGDIERSNEIAGDKASNEGALQNREAYFEKARANIIGDKAYTPNMQRKDLKAAYEMKGIGSRGVDRMTDRDLVKNLKRERSYLNYNKESK